MADSLPHARGLYNHAPPPPPPQQAPPPTSTSAPPPPPHSTAQRQQQQQLQLLHQQHQQQHSHPVHPSLLQPRVAVVLNVPPPWHPWLFALRLASVLPALWWGLPSLLQLLLRVLPGPEIVVVARGPGLPALSIDADARYALTETALATIWCFASGYLSFFFTDCLMSRWLINYTPQATMVRLLTINAINAYMTACVLSLAGGFQDPRLLLPGWIGIATTLTILYHVTHQKINIRKETSTSVNVFSIASFISMVSLFAHLYTHTPGYPEMPVAAWGRLLWDEAARAFAQARGSLEHPEL